jgi:hypothetical protein
MRMRRDDVPEQDSVFHAELPEQAMDDGRGSFGRARAGQLPLGREWNPRDSRPAISGGLTDEHDRRIASGVQVGNEAPAEQR